MYLRLTVEKLYEKSVFEKNSNLESLCFSLLLSVIVGYLPKIIAMMKLTTNAVVAALFLSSEAYASHEETSTRTRTRRMRSVNIYSSTPQHNELDKDIVDPYMGLPDEREQRDLKRSKPKKKPKPSKGSAPDPVLEMSMPTAAIAPDVQSFSYSLQDSTSTEESAGLPHRRAEERTYNSAMMTGHSSVVSAATIVSAIAGLAAFVLV
jgi:hypothetical protein